MTANRSQSARIAALTRVAKEGGHKMTASMNEGKIARYEKKVDPDGVLDPQDRYTRARALLRADMQRLAVNRWKKK